MNLLCSIHDVAPVHFDAVVRLRALLHECGVTRATLLVVPDFHHGTAIERCPNIVAWLRTCVANGDEVCLHGQYHVQARPVSDGYARFRARAWTAGEGECLALDPDEAVEMLRDGRARLEQLLGQRVTGFVAPAWLEPSWFVDALRRTGFRWHEGRLWVERIDAARAYDVRVMTPVLSFATRTRARELASLAWVYGLRAMVASSAARLNRPARIALHPSDLASEPVMRCATTTIRALMRDLGTTTYERALA